MPNNEESGSTGSSARSGEARQSLRLPGLGNLPLPPTSQLLWLGGLGALAAFEVIEWPVALVVAAATYVAEQQAKSSRASGTSSSSTS